MSAENKNFAIKNFLNQNINVRTINGNFYKGKLIGVDEHLNLLLNDYCINN